MSRIYKDRLPRKPVNNVLGLAPRNMSRRQRHVVLKQELAWDQNVDEYLREADTQAVLMFKLEFSGQVLGRHEFNVDLLKTLMLAIEQEIAEVIAEAVANPPEAVVLSDEAAPL